MQNIPVADVRNFALMGHNGSGKTTLTDALAHQLGINDRMGRVDNGSSVSDFTDEEKARKISIFANSFSGEYEYGGKTHSIVFTDTPGYMDFYGQVIAAARIAEMGVIVVDAGSGVQVGTRRAWKCCDQNQVKARAIVVTGLDKENTRFDETLEGLRKAFGDVCVPVVLPASESHEMVDVLSEEPPPDAVAGPVAEARNGLIEKAAETDDALIEKFLEGESLTREEIDSGLVAAVADGALVPVFACLPLKASGLDEFLNGMCRFCPSPERKAYHDKDGHAIDPSPEAPFAGLVWRNVIDPFVGQLSFVRVLGGTLKPDVEVLNTVAEKKEKIGGLLRVNGKKQAPVESATAGDIVAVPKLKATHVNHTLADPAKPVVCEPIRFPNPVMFMAISAHTQADEDKLGTALARVCEQDPTLRVEHNTETHEIVLQGLGDVHIDVAVNLMKSQSNVQVDLATPRIPYRETVTTLGEGHHKHKKQSGGRGQYGEVFLRVEPLPPGDEEWFCNEIVGGAIPHNFIPAVQKGIVEGKQRGSVAGYPVENIKVHIYDGSYHDVDSSEVAFKLAASRALRDAMSKAKPVLLEPIMKVRVTVPEQFMGDINGDLNHKRGRILGMEMEDDMQVIVADVPLAELSRYAAELRSMTGGQGAFEMEFARYDIVPANVTQKIVAEAKQVAEEED